MLTRPAVGRRLGPLAALFIHPRQPSAVIKQLLTDLVVIKQLRTSVTEGAGPRTGRLETGSLSQGW